MEQYIQNWKNNVMEKNKKSKKKKMLKSLSVRKE